MNRFIYFCMMLLVSLRVAAQDITQFEYFFETDLGFGKNHLIKAQSGDLETFLLDVKTQGLPLGFNAFYYRTMDQAGHWSHTQRKLIEIVREAPESLVSYEYFFDTDPGIGKGAPVALTAQEATNSMTFIVDRKQVSEGSHVLFVRAWDKYSEVSHTQWRSVTVKYVNCTTPTITMADGQLTASAGNSYQWYKDGQKIQGATKRSFTPVSAGQYSVEVTSSGCTVMSKEFSFVITAIEPAAEVPVDIFPNPFQNELTVRNGGTKGATLFVYALNGNLVKTIDAPGGSGRHDLGRLPAGIYVCKIRYDGRQPVVSTRIITKY